MMVEKNLVQRTPRLWSGIASAFLTPGMRARESPRTAAWDARSPWHVAEHVIRAQDLGVFGQGSRVKTASGEVACAIVDLGGMFHKIMARCRWATQDWALQSIGPRKRCAFGDRPFTL